MACGRDFGLLQIRSLGGLGGIRMTGEVGSYLVGTWLPFDGLCWFGVCVCMWVGVRKVGFWGVACLFSPELIVVRIICVLFGVFGWGILSLASGFWDDFSLVFRFC